LIGQLSTDFDFVADAHHIVIFGWCTGCLQQPDQAQARQPGDPVR
jgi:hypothetical protein